MMTKELIAVAAIAENYALADDDGRLPWEKRSNDHRQYKDRVRGFPIIVGRRTYESLWKYNQDFISQSPTAILTRNEEYTGNQHNHIVVHSKDEALKWIENQRSNQIFNLGGGQIYDLFFEETDKLILTRIPEKPDAAVFFPEVTVDEWERIAIECFDTFTVETHISK